MLLPCLVLTLNKSLVTREFKEPTIDVLSKPEENKMTKENNFFHLKSNMIISKTPSE
jgi:hypothetical protein